MLSLPSELDQLCFTLFMQCEEFDSTSALRAVFVTTELAPFAPGLPERRGSKRAFVNETKLFLLEKRLADGRALFFPFLETLASLYPQGDALYGELNDLYQQVLAYARSAEQPAAKASAPSVGVHIGNISGVSGGTINIAGGDITQHNVNTNGGAYIAGNVDTQGGDFAGRDKNT